MTVNKKVLDKISLTKEEKASIVKMIQTAWDDSEDSSAEHLAANFLKSLTNYNVRVNILELLQKFDLEDLANCMSAAQKTDIDSLIVGETTCC